MRAFKTITFFGLFLAMVLGLSVWLKGAVLDNENLAQFRNKNLIRIQKEEPETLDVLVVGDSLSYTTVSPMTLWNEYGIAAFDCGQAGQKIQETYRMLELAFETQSPKLVMLETNTLFRKFKGAEGIQEDVEYWGNTMIPLLEYHDVWKNILGSRVFPEENYKGFSFRVSVEPFEGDNYMETTQRKAKIHDATKSYMERIQKLCKENGAELLLFSAPSPLNYNYKRHKAMKKYAKACEIPYLNLNLKVDELQLDWAKDSLDGGDHLNLSGAEKATEYLGAYLKEHYELADHREEKAYAAWVQNAKEYDRAADKHLRKMADKA